MNKQSDQESQGYHLSKCPWMTLGKCISSSLCRRKGIVLSPPFQNSWEDKCECVYKELWASPKRELCNYKVLLSSLLLGTLRLGWLELNQLHVPVFYL